MQIVKPAAAGTMESSDVYVEVEPGTQGLQLHLESVVAQQFGQAILETWTARAQVGTEEGRTDAQSAATPDAL